MKADVRKGLAQKTNDELITMLRDVRQQLFTLRLEKAQRKLKNTKAVFVKRKEIARILTKLREKELTA